MEPKTPQTTTAAIKNVCFKPTRFIAPSLKEHLATNLPILDLFQGTNAKCRPALKLPAYRDRPEVIAA
jgi:hypothetical protein